MSKTIFRFYSGLVKMLLSRGYNSTAQRHLIQTVLEDDCQGFCDCLDQMDTNYEIANFRSKGPLNNFEKLIGVWKKSDLRARKQLDYKILLYFANVPDDTSSVNKQETVLAYSYLAHFVGVKTLYFLHINPISTTSLSQLTNPKIAPNNFIIRVISAASFEIDISANIYIPEHTLITDVEAFYAREKYSKGSLPKINADDPAIINLGGSPGQIVKIVRSELFNGGFKTLYFREITSSSHPVRC